MLCPRPSYWAAEEDRQLRILWAAGWSVNAIASQLSGRSRNAITGRVFRLGLTPRPSPIPAKPVSLARRRQVEAGLTAAREAIGRAA